MDSRSFTAKLVSLQVRNALFRQLRKRVGSGSLVTVISYISDVLRGEFDGWHISDKDLAQDRTALGKAFGVFRSKKKYSDCSLELIDKEIEQTLVFLSARLGEAKLVDILADRSDDQVVQARNQLRALLTISTLGATGQDASKLANYETEMLVLAKFNALMTKKDQGIMLLYFLALSEDSTFQGNVDRFLESYASANLREMPQEGIDIVNRSDPALADFLRWASFKNFGTSPNGLLWLIGQLSQGA